MKRRAFHPDLLFLGVILALVIVFLGGYPLAAQSPDRAPPATLIADRIDFDGNANTIAATGNVEIFFEGTRLRAGSVTYDGPRDRVQVTGPLTLVDTDGRAIILADFADLRADLQDGVLRGARLVLDRQLQIAANRIDRAEGRYTQAYKIVASTCEVCAEHPTPLWEIRAQRIIHDQEARQLYFEDATFRALGVPIAYLPRVRLPDPSLERTTGFLVPSIRSDDEIGTHLRVPYFIELGDHADLTLTPWLGITANRTLEFRYRQALSTGDIEINGAISTDDLTQDSLRGYIFADGQFALQNDFVLDFAIESVTDRGYLTTYGFPDQAFLESFARISRTRRDDYFSFSVSNFASLQEEAENQTLPTLTTNAEIIRRFVPHGVGGIATISLDGGGYYRASNTEGVDGRDVARINGAFDWQRDTILAGGMRLAFEGVIHADIYNTQQGAGLTGTQTRVTPFTSVGLRYPLSRTNVHGVSHLIEPIGQIVWSETYGGAVPVEDSAIVEFDEGNLFALDRFPGQDTREEGTRANIGVSYSRIDPSGWSLGVTGGVVVRETDLGQFTAGSGLNGTRSDFLLMTHLTLAERLQIINRAVFDQSFDFTSNELALNWQGEDYNIFTTYTFLEADLTEGRPRDAAEWAFDAQYDIGRSWQGAVNWRYDFVDNQATRAGLAIAYVTECVDIGFTLSRRFTTSTTVTPTTEFGLTVALNGFGASRAGRNHNRRCLR